MPAERVVSFRPRSILQTAGILIGLAIALWIVWTARRVLSWVLVAAFLALALDPAVTWLQRRAGIHRRGAAAGVIYLLAITMAVGLGFLLVPPVVDQIRGLTEAVPGYVNDLTAGRGPLGFLQTRYHVVDRVRDAIDTGGSGLTQGAGTVLSITQGIITAVVAALTITFLTFFMLLEGRAWVERVILIAPPRSQPRWRAVCARIAATISGYVTGNLLISVIAGTATALVLLILGVPFALALGLLVAILDLIPLAGATIAGIIVITIAALHSITAGVIVAAFVIVYQQLENHLLQPLVYGRTVQLSPLTVLISVLIGAEVAGVLGALVAIPVAGTLQILLADWLEHHRAPESQAPPQATADGSEATGSPPARGAPDDRGGRIIPA